MNPLSETILNYALVGAVSSGYKDPKTYQEAISGEDKEGWKGGINKEFNDMFEKKVWERIKKAKVPEGKRLLGSKWVFKKKKNGVFRARLVAKGYNQVPGVDYTESFAPVISDEVFRILIFIMLIKG